MNNRGQIGKQILHLFTSTEFQLLEIVGNVLIFELVLIEQNNRNKGTYIYSAVKLRNQ